MDRRVCDGAGPVLYIRVNLFPSEQFCEVSVVTLWSSRVKGAEAELEEQPCPRSLSLILNLLIFFSYLVMYPGRHQMWDRGGLGGVSRGEPEGPGPAKTGGYVIWGTGSHHILASPDFSQWRQYSGPGIGAGCGGGLPEISSSRPTPAPQ